MLVKFFQGNNQKAPFFQRSETPIFFFPLSHTMTFFSWSPIAAIKYYPKPFLPPTFFFFFYPITKFKSLNLKKPNK